MLKFLSIRDFVIVSTLELDFASGFTALTGETGAGKSILIDALSLALGERGDAALIRNGCERAEISAEFDIAALPQAEAWLREQAFEGDEGVCLLRRVIETGGRSRGFINGRSATLQQMREVGEWLLDIHGQHAHQSLLRPAVQYDLLDGYAGAVALAQEVGNLYRSWQTAQRRRIEAGELAGALQAERELLQFQHDELQVLDFDPGQWADTQAEHTRLSHAAALLEAAAFGVETLGEAEMASLTQLNAVLARLRDAANYDASLGDILKMLESAQAELQETVYALRHYHQHLDNDPARLAQLDARIRAVLDAARKYRVAPEQLGEVFEQCARRLAELAGCADVEALRRVEAEAERAYLGKARELSAIRQTAAQRLAAEITESMQTLAMAGGTFAVALLPSENSARGLERVEFQVAANPGTPPRSLSKVASGGELSRISLAIQVVLSRLASVPTLIFDEVDSGIGGAVAERVGRMLRQLGRQCQVLCVTHLPQVAAAADQQWQVSKALRDGQTLSHIAPLAGEARIEEIARMLGGLEITATTRQHAREMLAHAG
ncbi:MAG: DNA repair protein RecN [Gallionella sp.]|nr:DNA repair protein RecN [Gallionella sp.]